MYRRLLLLVAVAFAATGFAPVPIPKEKRVPEDLQSQMVGKWIPPAGAAGSLITISKDGWKWTTNEVVTFEATATLGKEGKPRPLDLKDGKGMILQGIVKVEGDTLTFAYERIGNEKPSRLKDFPKAMSPCGGGPKILKLERVK